MLYYVSGSAFPLIMHVSAPIASKANSSAQFIETRRAALETWLGAVLAVQDSLGTSFLWNAMDGQN